MDFPAPVGNTGTPPNPNQTINTLSGILGLQQARQNLQTGQYRQQTAQAQAQQEQQTTQQRQAAAQFFQNYDVASHVGPDGTIDLDQALTNPQLKTTGDAYPAIAGQIIDMKNKQLDAKTKLATLTGDLRQQFYKNVGGLSTDSDVKAGNATGVGKVLDAIDEFGQSGGPDAARVAQTYKPIIQSLQQRGKADKLPEVLRNFQLQAQDAANQTNLTRGVPGTMDTGGTIQPGQQNAFTGEFTPAGVGISKTLPPGAIVVSDAYKRQWLINQQSGQAQLIGGGGSASANAPASAPSGGALGQPPSGAPGQPQAGAPSGGRPQFAQPVPGQEDVMNDIKTAREQGTNVGTNRYVNSELLRLSSNTATGPGTEAWHRYLGMAGAPFGANAGSDYQLINAYLDRQAAMNASAMGLPNTNAGLQTSQSLSGNASYSPAALQAKVKLSDALNTATDQYRQGLDKAVGTGNNPNLGAYQRFRSQWSTNFDPRVFALENAIRDGDSDEQKRILSSLKPAERAELTRKRTVLTALSNGRVP